ncbi:unnamed protein product [Amoebophrya sp. A25]|nr:unnamed protein product [Amoebophrya sp. A25]|eukprot:GSA25T00023708001.1
MKAWEEYGQADGLHAGGVPNLAGITLQRHQLIPKGGESRTLSNGGAPFLFRLVGSIAFSPNPIHWRVFVKWIRHANWRAFDVAVPGLVTTAWWKQLDRRTMWTQHFIFFCEKYNLFTLYITAHRAKALAVHWRERGEHIRAAQGPDATLVTSSTDLVNVWPAASSLSWYGWGGEKLSTEGRPGCTMPRGCGGGLHPFDVDARRVGRRGLGAANGTVSI